MVRIVVEALFVVSLAVRVRIDAGEEVPMATLPLPSMTRRSLVPITDEDAILNLPLSARSSPMDQLVMAGLRPETVLDAENTS